MKIQIYDPAMCCSTGVCGPSVDPELVRIQETLRQLQKQAPEVQVQRYSLSTEPQAFVANTAVSELLKCEGPECLPLIYVDGVLVCKGSYPANAQIEGALKMLGIDVVLVEKKKGECGCSSGDISPQKTCCG